MLKRESLEEMVKDRSEGNTGKEEREELKKLRVTHGKPHCHPNCIGRGEGDNCLCSKPSLELV